MGINGHHRKLKIASVIFLKHHCLNYSYVYDFLKTDT